MSGYKKAKPQVQGKEAGDDGSILNKLHASGKVVVSQLAVELNVSEDTIRRDLLDLDQKGQVKRVFGGALPLEQPVIDL